MRKLILVAFQLLLATCVFGQDLDRLRDRAQKFLLLKTTNDKAQAVQYIEASGRQEFLESRPLPLQDARIAGLEFTSDPKTVYVIFDAKVVLPDIGPVPRTGREPWVWDKKDWFLHVEHLADPFTDSRNGPSLQQPKPISFQFSSNRIDLGKHVQGETVKQTIDFKANRDEIFLFRPKEAPGLSIGPPTWTSNETGKLELALDTTLLSDNVDYQVELEIDGWEEQKTRAAFELTAEVEPRLRFSQTPEIIDPAVAGSAEIRIENRASVPFRFLTIASGNPVYKVGNSTPEVVQPGQSAILTVTFEAQENSAGTVLNFRLSEPILGKPVFSLPLRIKPPAAPPPVTYTRQQLEEYLRKAK